MTNGDKIRNMTDEELAFVIMCPYDTIGEEDEIMPCMKQNFKASPTNCCKCVEAWLKKEAPEPKPEPAWKQALLRTFLGRN